METIIEVYSKNVYGRPLFYPRNEQAKQIAALMGRKTFNPYHISQFEAIGFVVKNLTFSPDQA